MRASPVFSRVSVLVLSLILWSSSLAASQAASGDAAGATAAPAETSTAPVISLDNAERILTQVYEMLVKYGLQVLGAILIFLVGRWVAKLVSGLLVKVLKKAKVDPTLVPFIENLAYTAMLVFVVVAALGQAGVQTASFIAVLGAAGLAVGLALQGSLANFASGVLLLIFKPFRVGDYVQIGGVSGTVQAIQIFNTVLNSPDNVRIVVPNATVTGGSISNYTINGTRRVDLVVSVSYGDDLKKARRVIENVLAAESRLLADPAPVVAVNKMGDSSVDFVVRPWVEVADYWAVYWSLTEKVKVALDENGLTIPFPQQEVYVHTKPTPTAKTA